MAFTTEFSVSHEFGEFVVCIRGLSYRGDAFCQCHAHPCSGEAHAVVDEDVEQCASEVDAFDLEDALDGK